MSYLPGLLIALGALWFALSGHVEPLFLIFAGVSILAALWIAGRLRIVDRDASPYHRASQLLLYFGWLAVEIAKSNVAVIMAILNPRRTINPVLVSVPVTAKTDLGKALFANSITLTPGTVTADVEPGMFVVHALQEEAAPSHSFAGMDRRAARAGDGRTHAKVG